MIKKITLSIPEISCSHCTSSIDAALRELDGIKSVESSVEKREATVEFASEIISEGAIIEIIDDIGFAAEVISQ